MRYAAGAARGRRRLHRRLLLDRSRRRRVPRHRRGTRTGPTRRPDRRRRCRRVRRRPPRPSRSARPAPLRTSCSRSVFPTDDGDIRLTTLTEASVQNQLYVFNDVDNTMVNQETGEVFREVEGTFTSDTRARSSTPAGGSPSASTTSPACSPRMRIRGPFVRVFLWTFVFAAMSGPAHVHRRAAAGDGAATTIGSSGRKAFRDPVRRPVRAAELHDGAHLGGHVQPGVRRDQPDARGKYPMAHATRTLAKFSILIVNLWLGFPYMFLICTGALQAIPEELKEASYVDGASPRSQAFRGVTFPLLLVSRGSAPDRLLRLQLQQLQHHLPA